MKVYVVKIFYDDENGYEFWDENPCVHGIYTTKEKAEKSIEEYLSQFEDEEERELYICNIEEWELDA